MPSLILALAALFSATISGRAQSDTLATNDWRQVLVGSWQIEFRLDSVRGTHSVLVPWQQASRQRAAGTFEVSDAFSIASKRSLITHLSVDFSQSWGRPMSCYRPGLNTMEAERQKGYVQISFTPGVFDCGFGAEVRVSTDSMAGIWEEVSIAGVEAMGGVFLKRAPVP